MKTRYLRFPDETAAMTAIKSAGFTTADEDGTVLIIRDTHDYSLDPVGILYNDDAIVDPETGEIIFPSTPMDGWHVNYIGILPEGWEVFAVNPRAPRRKFAGVD